MPRILAVSNQKGGVAKTTSCISIAAALVEHGKEVLMIDLDPQANLTTACGFDPDALEETIVDLLPSISMEETSKLENVVLETVMPGLKLLPADVRLAALERQLYNQSGYENILRYLLKDLPEDRFVVIDCPPSLGALTLLGLTAADMAIIPVQCEYFATRGLMQLLDVINYVTQQTNPDLSYCLFASMYDQRNLISRQVLENLQEHFNVSLCESIIRVDTRLRESAMVGEPIQIYAPRTRAAEEYRQLAEEIIEKIRNLEK